MKFLIRVTDEAQKKGVIPRYSIVAFSTVGRTTRIGMVMDTFEENGNVAVQGDSGLPFSLLNQLGFDKNNQLRIAHSDYEKVIRFS